MPRSLLHVVILICLAALPVLSSRAFDAPDARADRSAADPLATLRPGHPRLLVTGDTWEQLRARAAADADFRALLEAEVAYARTRLAPPAPVRELEGIRLLAVSRRVLADAVSLSLAYRVTGERVFLEIAERNLRAAASFSDWNPNHFLDVAEMTAALALGYDWLYSELSPETRAALRVAIADKGIRPGLDPASKNNWWHTRANNWNQICLAGLTVGALAVAEDEPDLARRMLALLHEQNHHGLVAYAPDGIYPEGPTYWRYGTHYTVLALAALRSALGSDSIAEKILPPSASFFASARAQALVTAPSGLPYNFADGGRETVPEPLQFWFARRLGDPSLLAGQRRFYTPFTEPRDRGESLRSQIFAILDWQTPPASASAAWTAWHGDGPVPLAVFRGPDTPRGAFYLALKGGAPSDSHAHMDGGSFVLELDGVRWAHDLGMQQYHALEKQGIRLFEGRPGGDRWKIFRYTNLAHSTLSIDGALHAADGRVRLMDFSDTPDTLGVTVDLEPSLAPAARTATRRFTPHADARGLTITDRLDGLRRGAVVRWTLVTRAEVELGADTAMLRESGRELRLRFSGAPEIALSLATASGPADFDEPARGYRLLVAETAVSASRAVALAAEFTAP